PIGVISGRQEYPGLEEVRSWVDALAAKSWFIPAGEKALELGNPILANSILIGALAAMAALPLNKIKLEKILARRMSRDKAELNLLAFQAGMDLMKKEAGCSQLLKKI
ncbi:MAG: 2-oxoacid:acceptor oxidoreductase family protein, partial [Thermodesulfobacteriota bacterium]